MDKEQILALALFHARDYLTFKLGGRKGCDIEEIVCGDEIYAEIVDELAQQFEALIESYKAELLKEVGEPVAVTNHAQLGYVTDGMHPDIPLAMWAKETSYSGANIALYTSDQVAAAIIKGKRGEVMDTSNFKEVFESPKVKTLTAQVAALELEVVRMRGALETFIASHDECEDADGWMAQMCSMEALHVADEVLSTPFTHTVLNELIEKVEKMTIERCAQMFSDSVIGGRYLADQVRTISTGQIKLEELL